MTKHHAADRRELEVSPDLSLPLDLAARTQCIFAQKGAGKTYLAGVETEEMLAAGVQVCVFDPTGVWWGLQSSSGGGKSPYEIIVMGGGHADVPLEPDAGEIVAQFLVETGQSVVLDVSQFESQAAQDRFALALATKLYRLKAHDKANIHIFLDEADQFCPMKPQKGQEKLLHAWDLVVRLGRSRGLGLTAISNRPPPVHTNIRNNIDLLTCLRVTGPHDFKALREWTGIHATADQANEFLESVPTLPDGEAWFWSPSWLRIFKRGKVRKKHTFDSSRTPKPGERPIEPKARRKPDLTKLTEQIRASVQRAKETDPKALRAEVERLRKELAAGPKPAPAGTPKADAKLIARAAAVAAQIGKVVETLMAKIKELPTLLGPDPAEIEALVESAVKGLTEKVARLYGRDTDKQRQALERFKRDGETALGQLKGLLDRISAPAGVAPDSAPDGPAPADAAAPAGVGTPRRTWDPDDLGDGGDEQADAPGESGEAIEQRILDSIAWWNAAGVAHPLRAQVAFVAKASPAGGYYSRKVGELKQAGLLRYPSDNRLALTEEGAKKAAAPAEAPSYRELLIRARSVLRDDAHRRLFDAVVKAGGAVTRDDLAVGAKFSDGGGYFARKVGELKTAGLFEYPTKGTVGLSEAFSVKLGQPSVKLGQP